MKCSQISADVSITGQLSPRDLSQVRALGFRSVICNRPDGEGWRQPLFETIAEAARQSDVDARYLPVGAFGPAPGQTEEMARLLQTLPGPVLAYCRSGTRSGAMVKAALAIGTVG